MTFRHMKQVMEELVEMQRVGIKVPPRAIAMSMDPNTMDEYSSMGISECADLLIARALVDEPVGSIPPNVEPLYDRVMEVLDLADEFQFGLNAAEYVRLMELVGAACEKRAHDCIFREIGFLETEGP